MQPIATQLKGFHPKGFCLYVNDSPESKRIVREMEPFKQAGMLIIAPVKEFGGFVDDVPLPRLMREGDVMSGRRLQRFVSFLLELNQQLLNKEGTKSNGET